MYLDEIKCIWAEKKFAQQYDNWDDKVNGDSIPKRGKVTEIIVVVFVAKPVSLYPKHTTTRIKELGIFYT